jgi:DNA-binding PadR family transcriptional regulator
MTNAELAILSLIAGQPRHGYEIEQVIEGRGMREWTEVGFSSIYYLLKKLERGGLVVGQLQEAERGPARKVYRLTPDGREALRAGVLDALSVPRRCYPPLQLGLANLPGIPPAEALAALRQYRDGLAARLEHVQARRESQRPLPYFVDAMFDHSVTMIEAELDWINQFIAQLEEQK